MKTTLEISTPLLRRAKRVAHERGTTLRALVEEGLSRALDTPSAVVRETAPLPVFGGGGLTAEFQGVGWERIQEAIYEGRGG